MLKEPFAEEIDLEVSLLDFCPEQAGRRPPYGDDHPYALFTGDEGTDENLVMDMYRPR